MSSQGLRILQLFFPTIAYERKTKAMTSDVASEKRKKRGASQASQNLDIALGKTRISLGKLSTQELTQLIAHELHELDIRELRGFKSLRGILSSRGDEPMGVGEEVVFLNRGYNPKYRLDLESQTLKVCRGLLTHSEVYRRYESSGETTDYETFQSWGRNGGYLDRGQQSVLLLRRLPKYSDEEEVLVDVTYDYAKVPHKNEHVIVHIVAEVVPASHFCKHFADKTPEVARDLFWELRDVYSRTVNELEGELGRIRTKTEARERLAGSIYS